MLLGGSLAFAGSPTICTDGGVWPVSAGRTPPAVAEYLQSLGDAPFNQRNACALWAGSFSIRNALAASNGTSKQVLPARLILFPAEGVLRSKFVEWLKQTGNVRHIEIAK